MGRPQLTARVSDNFAARVDRVLEVLTEQHKRDNSAAPAPERPDAVRLILSRGLPLVEADFGLDRPAARKPARKTAKKTAKKTTRAPRGTR